MTDTIAESTTDPSLSLGMTAVQRAVDYALRHVGVCEEPPGSNRGPEIDAWATEFGSPLGSFWCALAVGKARKEGGLWIPSCNVGACNEWVLQGTKAELVTMDPAPGSAVVYTNGQTVAGGRYDGQRDAVHIGLVLRVEPVLLSIEGNTVLASFDPNGWVQTLKEIDLKRVLCFLSPEPQ